MIDALEALAKEYADIQLRLQDPGIFSQPSEVAKLGKRSAYLEPLVRKLERYREAKRVIKDSEALLMDLELAMMAAEEIKKMKEIIPQLEEDMRSFLVPRDPMDERNAVLEVRAGTGGEEAALFAAELVRMYLRFAEGQGWVTELVDKADSDTGGIKEAVLRIEGSGVYGMLKFEGGVHRVQRIPATENKGRVHTSAATVAVLPEAEPTDFTIRNEDLRIDTFRAGGAGGQHVNKTESAVRITHIPTGVAVACQTERSQLKNKERAMELLRTRLYAADAERRAKESGDLRSSQVGSGDRSEKIRTYNFPQDRLTDHRIGANFHNLPGIMEGNIGDIIEALQKADQERKLADIGS